MAEILIQDPGSNEAQSPLIAGITEGLNKLSKILNLKTSTLVDEPLNNVPIEDDDKNRIYQANNGKRLWLSYPAPTFKKNGEVITQSTGQFSIDYIGGSISFSDLSRLQDSDTVTVSCTYIVDGSEKIDEISSDITSLENTAYHYKGSYETLIALQDTHPSSENGDFAIVLDVGAVFVWKNTEWKNSQSIEDLSKYYTKEESDNLLNQKEPKISPQGSSSDSDNYYLGGRKTWIELFSKIRSATLTGLSTSDNSKVIETDTLLSAIGKLQSQILGIGDKDFLSSNSNPTTSTKGVVGQRYVNNSNGTWFTCVSSEEDNYVWVEGQNKLESLKNPNALTLQLNGSNDKIYDGSEAQTFNVTANGIGAAPTNHTHNHKQVVGLTENRVLISDSNGAVSESEVTSTELSYLSGVTGSIQTQLNQKATVAQGKKADTALQPTSDVSNTIANFTQASTRENLAAGEKLSVLFGKIKKWFADLKSVAFSGSYNDLFDKPTDESGILPISNGGTGANNGKQGLKKLGLVRKSYVATTNESGGLSLSSSDFGNRLVGLVGVVYNKKAVIYWNEPTSNGANASLYNLDGTPIKNTTVRIHVIMSALSDWS